MQDRVEKDETKDTALRVGVFGGTFDPIHTGHLVLLAEACQELALESVYLMPAADPPHKQDSAISPIVHRIRMCALATLYTDSIRISRIDADRPGPHYSADMVQLLKQQLDPVAELFFLMGLDSLRDLPTWHEPERLMAQCTLAALSRADVEVDWPALEALFPDIRFQVRVVDMPLLEISGTDIRRRVRDGRPIRYQVPLMVEEYIRAYGLYLDNPVEPSPKHITQNVVK